jgi:rRNA maturation endonuclease Nob1
MKCKKCATELNENAKFCSECGEKVIKELKYKHCGNT